MINKRNSYIAEEYWNAVAKEIKKRDIKSFVAGDNDPYYSYKRRKFLDILNSISFSGKKVIEIGCGPGGNLMEIYKQRPSALYGVDISTGMLELCKKNTFGMALNLKKIDGENLPFGTNEFDIVFTSTVLQHITDKKILANLIHSIQRVAATDIFLFERIEKRTTINISNIGRRLEEYHSFFPPDNFELLRIKYLNVYWSRIMCGFIRRAFNSGDRNEGERQSKISFFLQAIFLPITKLLDKWLPVKSDVAMLHFRKR